MSRKITPFKFKQFEVHHDRCSMKVGTDAVLLGAWTDVQDVKTILEVGSGSGIISLMLAQRTPAAVNLHAVEIEQADAEQAQENCQRSPWSKKINIHHQSFQSFRSNIKFDLVVSNPPYFINSQLPPSDKRSQARHTHSLAYTELIEGTLNLLGPSGRLAVILPMDEGKYFQSLANESNLYTTRQLAFFSRKGKPQERWLFEFGRTSTEVISETLILHGRGEDWSDDYKNLTKDFYIKL